MWCSARSAALLSLLASLTWSGSAQGQSSTCQEQLLEAQELQDAGKMLLARPLAIACAEAAACAAATRQSCGQLLATLRRQIPSLVFSIRDHQGQETDEVSLYVDGELRTQAIPATPFELDPGAHELRAELRDGSSKTLRVVLAPGEQLRQIRLSWQAPPPAKRLEPRSGTPRWLTVSLGTLALASAGSFIYFANDGQSRVSDLQARCAPACREEPVRNMRRAFLLADVSWIVGALAAGGATWSYFSEAH